MGHPMEVHKRAVTLTRLLVVFFGLLAIWTPPGIFSGICASMTLIIWLYMVQVIQLEEKFYEKISLMRNKP